MINLLPGILAMGTLAMAVMQLNDPDPLFWVTAYGVAAACCTAVALDRSPRGLTGLAAGMLLAGLLISLPGFMDWLGADEKASLWGDMDAAHPEIESSREFFGAVLALIALALCQWQASRLSGEN